MWTITYDVGKHPMPTVNAERSASPFTRAKYTRDYRNAAYLLARSARIPQGLTDVEITVHPQQHRGPLADVAAHLPGVKAMIDGLVDAGVMDDDTPNILTRLTFTPPTKGKTAHLRLTITGNRPCKAPTEEST